MTGLLPFVVAVTMLPALPAQATAFAQNQPPGLHLMWATRTVMRIGWSPSPGESSYSYRLDQMNGVQVRSGQEPGDYHTATFRGLHPGWRYRCMVRAGLANGLDPYAHLYVSLPGPMPPREYAYQWAESQAGARYLHGGQGDGGFDCSGLVRTAYRQSGIWLPRTTDAMLSYQRLERERSPRQGDLVFFGTGHVELYDAQGRSFGAETGPGVWWNRWWPGSWWPTAFYRVYSAG